MSMTPEKLYEALKKIQEPKGCFFNKDMEMTLGLLEGLLATKERYGYMACPCRLPLGEFELDRDIVCPCDYRDPDVEEHGSCYCCLYVDDDIHEGRREMRSIPERRPQERQMKALGLEEVAAPAGRRLYYCRVCGYVAFREEPPYVCPICRAKREMFAEISASVEMRTR